MTAWRDTRFLIFQVSRMETLLLAGDCLARMRELPDASVHAVVTDPPYHLTSIEHAKRSKA